MSTQFAVVPSNPIKQFLNVHPRQLPNRLRRAGYLLETMVAYMDASSSKEFAQLRDAINAYLAMPADQRAELEERY